MSFLPKSLEGTALYSTTGTAEESMKIGAVRYESEDLHRSNMYYDAAKRVVFRNCMTACDLTDEQVPNFNANFYFNMVDEQKCLQQCFNTKMNLHFGKTVAADKALYLDFAAGKE